MSKIILSKNFARVACKLALNEDLYPSDDITSNLLKNNIKKKVKIISNQNGVIGGLEFAIQTFKLIDKKINLVINTTKTQSSVRDSYSLRRTSLMNNIPYYTTIAGAKVAVDAIEVLKKEALTVRSLQSIY